MKSASLEDPRLEAAADQMSSAVRQLGEERAPEGGRVLFVSLRFPPHGGAGVQRTSRFARYLPEFGWHPHVLTGPAEDRHPQRDVTMLEVVPDDVPITRTAFFDSRALFRWLRRLRLARVVRVLSPCFPSMHAGWIPSAYRNGRRLLDEGEFDMIFSSAYPMSSHVVAYLLKKRTGLPWVADYRDEWSMRRFQWWPTRFHRNAARRLDRAIVETADRIVTTTSRHTASFRANFPPSANGKYATIPNGYDEHDFQGAVPQFEPPREGRFLLSHVGSLYRYRRPDRFLRIIDRLVLDGELPRNKFRVALVGHPSGLDRPHRHLKDSGIVQDLGFVSHAEAIRWMRGSSALLLINTERTNIPAKTFDYLVSGRPILAIVPEGPTTELLRRAGHDRIVDPEDGEAIARAVLELFDRWKAGELRSTTDPAVLRRYSRRRLTGELAALFEELVT